MINKVKKLFERSPGLSIKRKELAKRIGISSDPDYQKLKSTLYDLEIKGYLERVGKRYRMIRENRNRLTGIIAILHEGNFGFVSTSGGREIYIPEKSLNTALNGDKVEISLLAKRRRKNIEGKVVKILSRANKEIIGTLRKSKSFFFVDPDDSKIHRDIYIPREELNGAKSGDKVIASEIEWDNPLLNPEGIIKQVLGAAGAFDTEITAIAHEFDLPFRFPKNVLRESESIETEIPANARSGRIDLRDEIIFTIDPEDAKDFDDAVSIKALDNGNYYVGIHIADVSHYVNPDSAIFTEALKRGTSVYLVGKVIPMLPENLSNGICSLNPGEDRLTFSVFAELSKKGRLVSFKMGKSIINSKKRFTYKEAQIILDDKKGAFFEQLSLLNNAARQLRMNRVKSGSINFITPEIEFELDQSGKPVNINIKKLSETNELIEEFMLLANKIVAMQFVNQKKNKQRPFVFRVHDKPGEDKLNEFSVFLKTLGYNLDTKRPNINKQVQKILDSSRGSAEESLLNELAIRSMAKAVYSTENIGHFGLAFPHYTHFTSPIRRFPDLIVHLLLENFLEGKPPEMTFNKLDEICRHSTECEKKAVDAERYSKKLKQLEYLRNKIGYEYDGVISGVTNFGLFVKLSENLAEGLIKLSDLDDDFYIFDEKNHALRGRSNSRVYRLGDRVRVKIIRVDLDKKEIDFILLV